MPEYVALRCYSCGTFQSHQLRKDSKFKCTICGASQSYRKVYCRSFKPTDVRAIVQDYNMRRGEIDQQEAAEARQTMERKANAEESDGDSTIPLPEENPWGEYEAEDARNRKKEEELIQAGDDNITTEVPMPVSAGRGRGRGHAQPKGWEVVRGPSKTNTKQSKRNRDSEEYDSEFTQSNGPRNKNKKQLTNTNSYNSNAFRDRNEVNSISNPGASASETGQSFALPRMSINNNSSFEKSKLNNGLKSIANSNSNNSKVSLPPSALLPASPGDLERQKRLERAELMKRQFQERLQAKQQADSNSGLTNSNNISVAQLPKATSSAAGSSEPSFRPPVSNGVNINRRGNLSAKMQSPPKSEWDEYLEDDVRRDRSDSEDDLVFEQEQTSNWETL